MRGQPVTPGAATLLADRGLLPRPVYDGSGTPVGTVSSVEPSEVEVAPAPVQETGRGNR